MNADLPEADFVIPAKAGIQTRLDPGLRRGDGVTLPDQADRDAARKHLDRNVVVTAGAGTGKTRLLTDRALFTLLGRGVPIQSLVALTFTEKAAGEIKVRLSQRLSEIIAGDPWTKDFLIELKAAFNVGEKKALELAKVALENMDQAPIGTLHSFAAQLLRSYPLEAGVDPGFQVDEGDLWEDLFESEWAEWLDKELGERAPNEKEWLDILRLCPLEDIEALARSLCHARIDLRTLHAQPSGMSEWLKKTADILEAEPARQPKAKGKIEEQLKEIAARLRQLVPSPRPSPAIAGEGELPKRFPSLKLTNASWPSGWDERECERWEAAKRLCAKCSPEFETLLIRATGLLRPFAEAFRKRYAWRGFMSFDGLLLSARNLARDNRKVREELKTKYHAFLVDEFQDTDPLQGELLMYLAEKPGLAAAQWQEVQLEPGKLFVVGDPKQSIYRFRGADIAAYEQFVQHIVDQREKGMTCELKTNFRSDAAVIDCVNATFDALIKPVPGSQPVYNPILPSPCPLPQAGEGNSIETVIVHAGDGEDASVARVRRTEAEWIAQWIEDNRGKHKYKDIALLLRSTTPLADYLEIFKSHGIPYVVEGEKYFYGTQEVQDFLNLLRAIDDPGDKIAVVGVLRSPIVALTDEEIRRLAVAGGLDYTLTPTLSRKRERENSGTLAIFETLREIRAMVGRKPLGEILQAVFDKTRILELASAAYHDQQTLANLLKLSRLATDAAEAQGETLKSFIHRVTRFIEDAREEGESPLADEHLDAVRVLTIHKSKGLEYPVVILPNLSGKIAGRSDRAFRVEEGTGAVGLRLPKSGDSAAMVYLEELERRREKDEQIRLLYVAFTRAKQRLILLGSGKAQPQSLAGLLQKAGLWPSLGPGSATTDVLVASAPAARKPSRHQERPKTPIDISAVAAAWKLRLSERETIEAMTRFVSPSLERRHALPQDDLQTRVPLTPAHSPEGRGGLAAIGRLCHKVLEQWDMKNGSATHLDAALESAWRAISGDYAGADETPILEEARTILSGFMESKIAKELAGVEILGRELPFIHASNGQIVRGTIDLLCRRKGKLWIIDYKTDSVSEEDLAKKAKIYGPQMMMYVKAVKKALGAHEIGYSLVFLRLGRAVDGQI